jgi:hypothetical protein
MKINNAYYNDAENFDLDLTLNALDGGEGLDAWCTDFEPRSTFQSFDAWHSALKSKRIERRFNAKIKAYNTVKIEGSR